MSKRNPSNLSHRRKQKQARTVVVRDIRRQPPDLKKLAGALIEFAQAQAEADAQAQQARKAAARRRREDDGTDEQAEDRSGDDV